jgi:hypothetical protein
LLSFEKGLKSGLVPSRFQVSGQHSHLKRTIPFLSDIMLEGVVLPAKWITWCLVKDEPWKLLIIFKTTIGGCINRIRGAFLISDVITTPGYFRIDGSLVFKQYGKHGKKLHQLS